MVMEARAVMKQIGVPATKVRQVVDLIRSKPVEEALSILRFSPKPVAKVVEKTLRSAIANATNQDDGHKDAHVQHPSRIKESSLCFTTTIIVRTPIHIGISCRINQRIVFFMVLIRGRFGTTWVGPPITI